MIDVRNDSRDWLEDISDEWEINEVDEDLNVNEPIKETTTRWALIEHM